MAVLQEQIACIIKQLEDLSASTQKCDESKISIQSNLSRPLQPVYYDMQPIGFEQTGPIVHQITISDYRNSGKVLG